MNDHHDETPGHDPDLATRFAAAARPSAMAAVESDLDAVHRRSRRVQRRRVLGGTAAAGLLVLGAGALVVTRSGDDPTVSVSAAAGVEDTGGDATEDDPTTLPPADEPSDDPTGDPAEPPADDEANDATATADPAGGDVIADDEPSGDPPSGDVGTDGPPLELPVLDDFPIPELPPLPTAGPDGTTDWSAYVDQLGRSLETWVNELGAWLEANPEVTTWIELQGPFGPLDATIADGEIEDWLQNFDIEEWKAELDTLGFDLERWMGEIDLDTWTTEFDPGEFDLDTWLDGLDLDRWMGDLDVDRWLADLGLGGADAAFPIPDLEGLDELFGTLDLENLGTVFDGFDLDGLDPADLDGVALDELFRDLDLGELQLPKDAAGFEDLFDQLLGSD